MQKQETLLKKKIRCYTLHDSRITLPTATPLQVAIAGKSDAVRKGLHDIFKKEFSVISKKMALAIVLAVGMGVIVYMYMTGMFTGEPMF